MYSHYPGKPGLATCPLDSQSPVILILSILTWQDKTLRTLMVLHTLPHPLTSHYPLSQGIRG